uniref:Nucleolar protein 58/56 N-terminal domain-containing protein n=1 Tax=Leersia perrieri TaxID=77586 RepID=A0A0D9XP37_9ORYZ
MPKRRRGVLPPPDPSPAAATIDYSLTFKEIAASGAPDAFWLRNFLSLWAEIHLPDAIKNIWAKFGTYWSARNKFDDKSSAINVGTGVNKQLTEMIMKWRRPGQKLVVGKPEYKSIIETNLGIPCLYDEVVLEVMWGMKRHMSRFVPAEESKLPKEDSLTMSQGLRMFLRSYGFDIKPEMVNNNIVSAAATLFDCDAVEKKVHEHLQYVGRHLKHVSGIDNENWPALKLATAFKITCSREIDDSDEMFSDDVRSKLLDDADKYEDLVFPSACIAAYKKMVGINILRNDKRDELILLVEKAKKRT